MSITPAMKAAARSAYRNVYRASSVTFSGDEHVLKAFRLKMRNDAIAARGIIDPETYEQQNQLGREIADVLRKNIVQGVRVRNEEGTPDDQEIFRLRLTKYTELGSNDTIKNPPLMSNRSMRKQEKAAHHTSVTDVAPHNDSFAFFSRSHLSMNFSQLKKAHRERVLPELKEEDLEETFVRGSGPGGQSVNKTENNVQLLHKPTGIRVSCQETRSLKLNRRIARKNLLEKLDKMMNPGLSKEDFARAKQRERERRRRKKAKKKAAEKVSQDEGILEEDDLDEEANLEEEDLDEEAILEEEDLDEEANLDTNHSRNTERHDEKS
ncbi:putative peptide chain release factor C12orf65 like protein, mitochondrial [Termitomyces sp. J132]|nr:putative peptide chain release factor C12orf65 like protein, mitochondrial [Termitomyces sp. J132]